MKKIILFGPKLNVTSKKSYGGGTGGYTRNMSVYLQYFNFSNFQIIPCFHTIKGEFSFGPLTNPIRLLMDTAAFLTILVFNKIKGVHILGQYRGAVIREVFIIYLSKLFRIPILYEIKAGAFISSYESGTKNYKKRIDYIINNSDRILVEGTIYQNYIKSIYNKDSSFFPNVVPVNEIPIEVHEKFRTKVLKVIFVGFVYEGKGIKELIQGCNLFGNNGNKIELTLVGQIDREIEEYLIGFSKSENFSIIKKGKLAHSDVLEEFTKNDIYCYPTKHLGEGHNNTINEALMYGMVVSSTKAGFLGSFLNEDNSYPIEELNGENILKIFLEIYKNPSLAINKSIKGRDLILNEFNTENAKNLLDKHYREFTK